MKKRFLIILFLLLLLVGCGKKEERDIKETNNPKEEERIMEDNNNIRITINNKEYDITLEDNETVKELKKLLPLNITMAELNGNEKYIYLDNNLPTDSYKPKNINKGDVMLYGNNCLVIFYESFETPYSYTKIGHIDNLPDLGKESVKVKIAE